MERHKGNPNLSVIKELYLKISRQKLLNFEVGPRYLFQSF